MNELTKEQSKFTILDETGKEIECEVLFTFDSEETKKSYIVYTDNTKDETGAIKTYASIFDPNNPDSELQPIETEKEWKEIENILNSLQEKIAAEENGEKASE